MPVVPTFNSYAPAPNLSQAFLGGQEIQIARQRIAQQAASDAARIQLGREQLAQEAVQNEMELAAKQEALGRESMRRSQEQEIEKAYRETQLGLRERELKTEEAIAGMRIQEASREFDRMQNYQRRYQELTGQGMSPDKAATLATLEAGGTGVSTAIQASREQSNVPMLSLENRILQQQKQDLLRPFTVGGIQLPIPTNVQAQLDALAQRQGGLLPPSTMTATNAPMASTNAPMAVTNQPRTLRVVRDANGRLVIQR